MKPYGNDRKDNSACPYGCCCNKCGKLAYRNANKNKKKRIRGYGRGKARNKILIFEDL